MKVFVRHTVTETCAKSVVNDPLNRQNSEDNTPAIIHTRLVPGNSITLTVIPQGAGSENASSLKMFRPSATARRSFPTL